MKCPLIILAMLLISFSALAQKRELPPEPKQAFQWKKGAPYADEILADGDAIRIIKNGGITIAVTGYDTGDFLLNEVTIVNETGERFNVKPEDFFIAYEDNKGKTGYMYSLAPEKVAGKYKSRAKWGNFFRSFAAGLASTTITTQESGTVNIYSNDGSATGTYTGSSTTTLPNRSAQRAAANANAQATADANAKADMIISTTLKANTVFPQTYISGRVYFERKKYKVGNFIIIINDTAYIFAYYGTQK